MLYTVVDGLMAEFIPLFKTDFMHFGGDELWSYKCACRWCGWAGRHNERTTTHN